MNTSVCLCCDSAAEQSKVSLWHIHHPVTIVPVSPQVFDNIDVDVTRCLTTVGEGSRMLFCKDNWQEVGFWLAKILNAGFWWLTLQLSVPITCLLTAFMPFLNIVSIMYIDVKIVKYHTLGPAAPSRYCINNLLRHHHHEEADDGVTNMSRGVWQRDNSTTAV